MIPQKLNKYKHIIDFIDPTILSNETNINTFFQSNFEKYGKTFDNISDKLIEFQLQGLFPIRRAFLKSQASISIGDESLMIPFTNLTHLNQLKIEIDGLNKNIINYIHQVLIHGELIIDNILYTNFEQFDKIVQILIILEQKNN